jgi:hypothetical protein
VKQRTRYLTIAVLLTVLNGTVTAYHGVAIWEAGSVDVWSRGLWVLLAALGATSLANVWAQAVPRLGGAFGSRSTGWGQSATPIPAEARGEGDV